MLSADEQSERKGPFAPTGEQDDGMELTGADVFYLAAQSLAGPGGDRAARAAAEGQLRDAQDAISLRAALDLSAVHLEDADLNGTHLETLYVNTRLEAGRDIGRTTGVGRLEA
jgi:hypothetical protein